MERSTLDQLFGSGFSVKEDPSHSLAWLEADQLLKEGVKSASLFVRGKLGLVASAALYMADEVKADNKNVATNCLDAGLGALKGSLLHFSFHGTQSFPNVSRLAREKGVALALRKGLTADPLLKYFPEKLNLPARAMGMGIASNVIDSGFSRNTWLNQDGKFDAAHGASEIANRSASVPALLGYAGVFGTGHVVSKGVNRITKGLLERSSIAAASTMNASVGLVTGGLQEIGRENAQGECLDAGKIAAKGLLNAGISAIAAAPGALHSERQMMRELSVKPGQKKIEIEEVRKDKVSLTTCKDEPERLVEFFDKNGEPGKPCGLDVDANYYRIKGIDTAIVVPQAKGRESFAGSLNETLGKVAQVLRELPNSSLIKEVHLYDLCAYPRYAEASDKGRIRLYVGSNKYDFARFLRHEGGHVQDYAQRGLSEKFALAAEKEDAFNAGWNPAEGGLLNHAQSDAAENLATLSERLQAGSGKHFIECLQDGKAPLRSIAYADALKSAAEQNKKIDPAYLRRLDVIEEHARPRQIKTLKETIDRDAQNIEQTWQQMVKDEQLGKEIDPTVLIDPVLATARDIRLLGKIGSVKDVAQMEAILRQSPDNKSLSTAAFASALELLNNNYLAKAKFVQDALSRQNSIDFNEQRHAIRWLQKAMDSGDVSAKLYKPTVDNWYLQNHEKVLPAVVFEWLASLAANTTVAHAEVYRSARQRYEQKDSVFHNCQELINTLESRFTEE